MVGDTATKEQQWAMQLQKMQHKNKMHILAKKSQLLQRIKTKKEALQDIIEENNKPQAEKLYAQLVELRAELCTLNIEREKKDYGFIEIDDIEKYVRAYKKDCELLGRAIQRLLLQNK